MGNIKLDSTIDLEKQVISYINNNEIFWYDNLLKYLKPKNKDVDKVSKFIKKLCIENYIQPCDKRGNTTQYIRV